MAKMQSFHQQFCFSLSRSADAEAVLKANRMNGFVAFIEPNQLKQY